MKALILNSGIGKRMGEVTENAPKCMTDLKDGETILSRQLNLLSASGIREVVITTGPFEDKLKNYCDSLNLNLQIVFIQNPRYEETNYIYSIYLAKDELEDDIVLMHGDLVFEKSVLEECISTIHSSMIVSSMEPLPEKDFKAVVVNDKITKVGIEFFESAVTAQPMYHLYKKDWNVWKAEIVRFCENGMVNCYAENAYNQVSAQCEVFPLDIGKRLCNEIDTMDDRRHVLDKMEVCG